MMGGSLFLCGGKGKRKSRGNNLLCSFAGGKGACCVHASLSRWLLTCRLLRCQGCIATAVHAHGRVQKLLNPCLARMFGFRHSAVAFSGRLASAWSNSNSNSSSSLLLIAPRKKSDRIRHQIAE